LAVIGYGNGRSGESLKRALEYNTPSNTTCPRIEHLRESSVKLLEHTCSNQRNIVHIPTNLYTHDIFDQRNEIHGA